MFAAPLMLAGFQAVGTVISGMQSANNYNAQAKQADINATYARQDARLEMTNATRDAEQVRARGREQQAEAFTGFAQSGFGVTDSATMSLQDSATQNEYEALMTQYQGVLRNRSSMIRASNYTAEAKAARSSARAVPLTTGIKAATNLLSGAANMYGQRIA
jgi:hypothetical protein